MTKAVIYTRFSPRRNADDCARRSEDQNSSCVVKIRLNTGHEEPEEDSWETHEFSTPEERDAFIAGIELANEYTGGWVDGTVEVLSMDRGSGSEDQNSSGNKGDDQ